MAKTKKKSRKDYNKKPPTAPACVEKKKKIDPVELAAQRAREKAEKENRQ